MSDRLFAALWLLLCAAGLYIGWDIRSEYRYEPLGPRPFPLAIIGLMALCALLMFYRPTTTQWPPARVLLRLLLLIVTLLLYAWGFEWLGFIYATALLTLSISLLFGAPLLPAGISAVVIPSVLFFAFDYLLEVTLPRGMWPS